MSHNIPECNQTEIALRESERRLRRQNRILMKLARRKTLNAGDLNGAIREITEAAAHTLEIERVSVWLYNEERSKIYCADLYQRSENRHSQGSQLTAEIYPAYFKALEAERTIAAHDAQTDPRTKEFLQNYLLPLGLKSMLDAPIWLGGQMVGVVCHEQVEPGRYWALEEQNFAGSIADLVSLALESYERQQAETALRESKEKFKTAFRASPSAMAIASFPEGRLMDVNDSFLTISGYDREAVIGRTARELNLWVSLEDRTRSIELLQEMGAIRNLEFKFRKQSGEIFVGLYSAELINLGGIQCVLIVVTDISDRIHAEAQLRAVAERDRLLAQIASRIRRSLNLDQILDTTVAQVRQFLHADRVYIYQGTPCGQSKVVAESVDFNWPSIRGWQMTKTLEKEEKKSFFQQDNVRVFEDSTQLKVPPYLQELYTQYQIRAALLVPIMLGDEPFGWLAVHQCSGPRQWQPTEIELLKQLATQVAIAIQQAELYQQVQTLNANLECQVEERTAELQQKMQELQELNKIKDLFLHAVTHDLRTPVMGWLLVLNNLLGTQNQGENLPPTSDVVPVPRAILERMVQSSDRQLHLINSLLEAHSSEIHGLILHRQPVQLSQLIQSAIDELEPLLTKNQATLKNLIPPNLPLINADSTQLWRVFENLIANALNHNPPGLLLTLNATVENKEDKVAKETDQETRPLPITHYQLPITNYPFLRITLQDNGVGMTQETCDHLFELYVRGSHTRRSTSIGLGLYLCRQIITAHGGEIGVISSPGAGTTFWFTLPILSG
jgi:PAS domain S-box-containing protein